MVSLAQPRVDRKHGTKFHEGQVAREIRTKRDVGHAGEISGRKV